MPELPEVETTLNGIKPLILHKKIKNVVVRHYGLRWPIPSKIKDFLIGEILISLTRRGKYLLFQTENGTIIVHLGMSGSLRILTKETPPEKHDHVDIVFSPNICLRYRDPRRFGAVLWTEEDPLDHPLLRNLGPEPLTPEFTGHYLWERAQTCKGPIKNFIMNSKMVVGVGNIYAAEALFEAGIHPKKSAQKVSLARYEALVVAIKRILQAAIQQGGTTLKDFVNSEGKKGYFSIQLKVYGRGGLECVNCQTTLKEFRLGQRSTVYCPSCQK